MEYAQIIVTEIGTDKFLGSSIVMPKFFAELVYLTQMATESQKIADSFSVTKIVPCEKEKFDIEDFMLYLQFQNGEIDEEEYYFNLKQI